MILHKNKRPTIHDCRFNGKNKNKFRIVCLSKYKFKVQYKFSLLGIPIWINNVYQYYSYSREDGDKLYYCSVVFSKLEYAEEFMKKSCRHIIKFNTLKKIKQCR